MKRTAAKQITKDGFHDDGDDDEEQSSSQLAENQPRVIKGLPKRKGLGTTSAPSLSSPSFSFSASPAASAPSTGCSLGQPAASSTPALFTPSSAEGRPNPFATFSGFGTPGKTNGTSGVTGDTASAVPSTPSLGSSFGSAFAASQASPSTPSFSFSQPAANGDAKAQAPNPSSVAGGTLPSRALPTESTQGVDRELLQYFKSCKGVNASFVTALGKAMEQDPFADLSSLARKYVEHREGVEKKRPSKGPKESGSLAANPSLAPSTQAASTELAAPKPSSTPLSTSANTPSQSSNSLKAGPPKVPAGTSFTFANKPVSVPPPSSNLAVKAPANVPKFEIPSGGFKFGDAGTASASIANKQPEKSSASSSKQPSTSTSTAPVCTPASAPTSTSSATPATGAFGSVTKTPAFSFGTTSFGSSNSASPSTPAVASSSTSTASSSAPAPAFGGFGSSSTNNAKPSTTFSFGSSASPSSSHSSNPMGASFSDSTSSPSKPITAFSFGSATSTVSASGTNAPAQFSFGGGPASKPGMAAAGLSFGQSAASSGNGSSNNEKTEGASVATTAPKPFSFANVSKPGGFGFGGGQIKFGDASQNKDEGK
ncbi:hypothetical protein K437DRAFT_293911 [Tilletiaria anomala UBC 951]|uniref:Nuclear pore complex NUP2/50/61 domain-containing protein n=1 Tax=Tilletiaria anomala (strain ATCC 24038 / CBS 436.72 / UBC 951) TaxID=1037660 RepID=A0A066W3D9_TILAU|nr:uncharacterized protein K437DRAFT_293911 [Tilletiaria anomala UBC 951]KDN48467.1 hypothetical protein K437DRAFT_293911 [Tilletiaria anomala UBC 951]